MKLCFLLPVLSLSSALAFSAQASTVALNNFSFETPALNDGAVSLSPPAGAAGSGTFNGWGYYRTGSGAVDFGIENPTASQYTGGADTTTISGANGLQEAFLNNNGAAGSFTSIYQDVGLLQANTTFTLTVAIGQRLDRTNGSVIFALLNAPAGTVDPFENGTALSANAGVSSVAGSFQDFTTTFTTGATVTGDLYIGAEVFSDPTIQGSVDNFRLDAVPEPDTVLMMLGGIGTLVGCRRLRRS